MDDMHPAVKIVATITGVASGLVCTYLTVMAFINGGISSGLFWIFVIDPIAITLCYWISIIIILPIMGLVALIETHINSRM